MTWTDELVDRMSRLWLEGRSALQIACELGGGLTRSAVIGKVHREGLAGRVKCGTRVLNADIIGANPIETVEAAQQCLDAVEMPKQLQERAADVQPPNSIQKKAGAVVQSIVPAVSAPETIVSLSLKVTIVELHGSMCRWPIGDPMHDTFRYCGSPSKAGAPYCQHHSKLAYQPKQDRRRERDRPPMLAY